MQGPTLSSRDRDVLRQLLHGAKYGMELAADYSIYPTLSRLEDLGLVEGCTVAEDAVVVPRRKYALTDRGKEFLHDHRYDP